MDYASESFIKVCQRRTVNLSVVGWVARAVLVEMRLVCDSVGRIDTAGEDPAVAVAYLLRDVPLEVVRESLSKLAERHEIKIGPTTILIVEHQAIQDSRANPATRSRDYRSRRRAEAMASVQVPIFDQAELGKSTNVSQESQPVTEPSRHVTQPLRDITRRHDQIRSDQISPPNPPVLEPKAQTAPRASTEAERSEENNQEPTPTPQNPEQLQTNLSEPNPRHQRLEDLPIAELCRKVQENPHNASFVNLAERPEIAQINVRWANAVGLAARRLGAYQRDKGLQAIVEAYVLGYSEAELLAICDAASQDDWVCGRGKDGRKKGLVGMTPDKLGELHEIAQADAKLRRKREQKARRVAESEAAERRREAECKAEEPLRIDVRSLFQSIPSPTVQQSIPIQRKLSAEEIDAELDRRAGGGIA
jgi:hypothetical protein